MTPDQKPSPYRPLNQTQARILDEPTVAVPATPGERERCASLEVSLVDNFIEGLLLQRAIHKNLAQRQELTDALMEDIPLDPQLYKRYQARIMERYF